MTDDTLTPIEVRATLEENAEIAATLELVPPVWQEMIWGALAIAFYQGAQTSLTQILTKLNERDELRTADQIKKEGH